MEHIYPEQGQHSLQNKGEEKIGGEYTPYIYLFYEKLCQQLHEQTAKSDVTMTIMCVFI